VSGTIWLLRADFFPCPLRVDRKQIIALWSSGDASGARNLSRKDRPASL
jgi:hypothetical protein